MTWPLQPVPPRTPDPRPVAPVVRTRAIRRDEEQDHEQRRDEQRRRARAGELTPGAPDGGPDADGHIDVLA